MPSEDDWFIDWVLATPMTERARIIGIRNMVYLAHSPLAPIVLPAQFKRLEMWQREEIIHYPDYFIQRLEDMR